MKKVLSVFIVALFAVGSLMTAYAGFEDVQDDHDNVDAIEFLKDAEVVKGYSDGSFKPEFEINRAELMKILVESQGVTPDPDEYQGCFSDVADQWFAPYVCYAEATGWVKGYSDGTFKPEKAVNKVEAVKMLIHAHGYDGDMEGCDEELFNDTDGDEWYGKYLCVAKQKGLLEEVDGGKYMPGNSMVRAEIAENMFRAIMVKKLKKEEYKEEYKEMKGEALEAFKAEKEAIKAEIEAFHEELKQMKEDGEEQEYIDTVRKEFWDDMKELHKDHAEGLAGKLKETHDHIKGQHDAVKDEFMACKQKHEGNGNKGDLMNECGYKFEQKEWKDEEDYEDDDPETDEDDDTTDDTTSDGSTADANATANNDLSGTN